MILPFVRSSLCLPAPPRESCIVNNILADQNSEGHVGHFADLLRSLKVKQHHTVTFTPGSKHITINMASPRVFFRPVREVAFRARPQISKRKLCPIVQTRFVSDDQKISEVPAGTKGPNEDQLPHVSEEQAAMDKSMGNTPPDIEQGTPVKEVRYIRENCRLNKH